MALDLSEVFKNYFAKKAEELAKKAMKKELKKMFKLDMDVDLKIENVDIKLHGKE